MNYELAKKLKDAGFEGTGDSRYFYDFQKRLMNLEMQVWSNREEQRKNFQLQPRDVYIPILSELIKACGDIFYSLTRSVDGIHWMADIYDIEDSTRQVITGGDTAEEAVANLWLKLQEK